MSTAIGSVIATSVIINVISIILGFYNQIGVAPKSCPNPACSNDPHLCPGQDICEKVPSDIFNKINDACVYLYAVDLGIRVLLSGCVPVR